MFVHAIPSLVLSFCLLQAAVVLSSQCPGLNFPAATHSISLYPPLYSYNGLFSADITVGSQTLRAALDTGSSDTWLLTQNANCTEVGTLQPVTPDKCGYAGPRYSPGGTFEQIPKVNLNQSYGNGAAITGPLGYTELTFGDITVPRQEIGAVTYGSLGGNPEGNISGLIGLAYTGATTAYPGDDPLKDSMCTNTTDPSTCGPILYSPLLTTLFTSNLTAPLFSFALSRSTKTGGIMTIGGIPDLHDPHVNVTTQNSPLTATVPIEPFGNATTFTVYVGYSSGFRYPNSQPHAGAGQYIIDTGTYPNILPKAQADKINAQFVPPATFNQSAGVYTVPCNATAPSFGADFGGKVFYQNVKDMIVSYPGSSEICISAIQSSTATFFAPILGASFLQNVLAVFDVGASEMTFMSRMYYDENCD
ncbi:MAG: hypothetical protein Q9227_007889 [Pyrenula ochraceoflavens]